MNRKELWVMAGLLVASAMVLTACGGGGSSSSVLPSSAPESVIIQSITADPPIVRPGQATTLKVSANDTAGHILSYLWSSATGSFVSTNADTANWTAPDTVGSCMVHVTVSNGSSSAVGYASILVSASALGPIITSVNPPVANIGDQITITGAGFGALQGTSTVSIGKVIATNILSWGEYQITATVPAKAKSGWVTVTVGGVASSPGNLLVYAPEIVVSDSVSASDDRTVEFGDVSTDDMVTESVTIANNGTNDLVIGNIGHNNPLSGAFSFSADLCSGAVIHPAGSCTLTIQFAPQTAGSYSDQFDIPSNDAAESDVMVTVSGAATGWPVLVVTDTIAPTDDLQVPFGTVPQGNTVNAKVTLANNGTSNLQISNIGRNPQLAAPFSITSDACADTSLTPGATCDLIIQFAPVSSGPFSGQFDVLTNDPQNIDVTISVSGTGYDAPVDAPAIMVTDSVAPANDLQVPFGNVLSGGTGTQTVTITNTGTADLVISAIGLLSDPFSVISDTCSNATIAPAGTCGMTIKFTPVAAGDFSVKLDIYSNTSTATVILTGTGEQAPISGPGFSIQGAGLDNKQAQESFGIITTGNTSDITLWIDNIGDTELIIGQIANANSLAAPFSVVSDSCSGVTIPSHQDGGAACALKIRFAPSATGDFSDSFDIPSNDSAQNPVTVNVSGTGGGSANATVSGTITLPYSVSSSRCFMIALDTDTNPLNGIVSAATGTVTGQTISYSFENVPSGVYVLGAYVDMDTSASTPPTCSFANTLPTSGDFLGYYGGAGANPPVGPNVSIPHVEGVVYDFTLGAW
jgi:hypothetical protein